MDKKVAKKLAQEITKFVKAIHLVDIPAGEELVVKVSLSFYKVEPPIHVILNEVKTVLIKTFQPFRDEHFREILKLSLSTKDREFVEFYRNNDNKAFTAYELMDRGFAEKGRFASVNRTCRAHGLWLGIKPENTGDWDQVRHRFFVLEEKSANGVWAHAGTV